MRGLVTSEWQAPVFWRIARLSLLLVLHQRSTCNHAISYATKSAEWDCTAALATSDNTTCFKDGQQRSEQESIKSTWSRQKS